jgi:hypothetical protein
MGVGAPSVGAASEAGRGGAVAIGFAIVAAFSAAGDSAFVADRTSTFPPLLTTCMGVGVPPVGAASGAGTDGAVAIGFPNVAVGSFSVTGDSAFVSDRTSTFPPLLATCMGVGAPAVGATSGVWRDGAVATGFPNVAARSFSGMDGATIGVDRALTFPTPLAAWVGVSSNCVAKFALCLIPENQRRLPAISIATPTIAQSRVVT